MRSITIDGSMWEIEHISPGGRKVVYGDPTENVEGRPINLIVFRKQGGEDEEYVVQTDRGVMLADLSDERLVELLQHAQEEEADDY